MRSLIAALLSAALLTPCVALAQGTPPTTPAQDSPAQGAPSPAPAQAHPQERDSLEPAVDTSATPAAAAAPAQAPAPAPAQSNTSGGQQEQPKTASGKAMDHLELGTTDITGNRELPKVLYIVPWKSADLGDLAGKPLNSLVDEALQPIDRDVFKRENRYYGAVAQKASSGGKSGAGPAAGTDRNGSPAPRSSAGDER